MGSAANRKIRNARSTAVHGHQVLMAEEFKVYSGMHAVTFSIIAFVFLMVITVLMHFLMGRVRFGLVNSRRRVVVLSACLGTILGLLLNLLFVLVGFTERKFGNWCYDTFHFDDGAGVIPLMAFVVPIAVGTSLFAVFLDRKWNTSKAGRCKGCGYDLTGNVSGTCPECSMDVRS